MGQVARSIRPASRAGTAARTWLNTPDVLARENFASALVNSPAMTAARPGSDALPHGCRRPRRKRSLATILQGDAPGRVATQLAAYLDGNGDSALGALSVENFEERMRGAAYLTMAMPAYQLN